MRQPIKNEIPTSTRPTSLDIEYTGQVTAPKLPLHVAVKLLGIICNDVTSCSWVTFAGGEKSALVSEYLCFALIYVLKCWHLCIESRPRIVALQKLKKKLSRIGPTAQINSVWAYVTDE